MFNTKGIIIDGGRMKTEPWKVFSELEKELNLEPYFTEERFTKRYDGYYCYKYPDGKAKKTEYGYIGRDYMPETKGIVDTYTVHNHIVRSPDCARNCNVSAANIFYVVRAFCI